ncbi:MAG TPA: hypothetical protein VKM55_17900 [Candidatus Lokiarchaeia archaeon]|nr:hypothetical protein [Candidatus Lokiarchaeia archaeon]
MSDDYNDQRTEEPGDRDEHPQRMYKGQRKVLINGEALKSILLYAKRYANENIPEFDWKEVYGFLVGRVDKNKNDVHVDSAVPMTSGEATEVVFGPSHYSKAAELDGEIAEKTDGSFVCGWWHSHPFKSNPESIFLSSIDVGNQLGFQGPNPLAIAVVHDPSKIKERESPYGIKVFRLSRTDFTQSDLDRYALDLRPNGTTRSDPNEIVYYPVPFKIVGITPQLFIESLADVYETTVKGAPPIKAYREDEGRIEVASQPRNAQLKLSRIEDLAKGRDYDVPSTVDNRDEAIEDIDRFPIDQEIPAIVESLPEEMEKQNMMHVLSVEDFASGDEEMRTEEAEQEYIDALDFRKQGEFKMAVELLKTAYRVYSKLKANHKIAFIKNEMMECYFWAGEFDDTIQESVTVAKLATELENQYFLGNAHEFRGRAFLKKGDASRGAKALQDATVAFKKGYYFAKAGQCSEMIARIACTRENPDFDEAITFFVRALMYYQDAIKNPKGFEPVWSRDAFITNHGAMLQRQVKGLIGELKDASRIKQLKEMLAKLGRWY